jgi:hypothetical protein
MKMVRLLVGIMLIVAFIASFSVGYAYGVQYHVVNTIGHGCSSADLGCYGATNYAGNYYRSAQNYSSVLMHGSWVSIDDYAGNQYNYGYCNGANFCSAGWDTNPTWECKFTSLHGDDSPYLNYHLHYTESALC